MSTNAAAIMARCCSLARRHADLVARPFDAPAFLASSAAFALFATILIWPGAFAVGLMLNDVLTATEAAYRVSLGQMPGRDFTSALGVFAYLPHALAYRMSGDLVAAVPVSFAIYGAIALGLSAYIATTRLDRITGTALVATASILTMTPWVISLPTNDDKIAFTTAAMFYNRFGFVVVLLTALLIVPPHDACRTIARAGDVVWAVCAGVMAYYTKMPFGFAVLGLFGYWALVLQREPRLLAWFMAGLLIIAAAVEMALPGINLAFIDDMRLASGSATVIQPRYLLGLAFRSAHEVIVVAVIPLAILAAHRRVSLPDIGFFVCLYVGSLLLLSQSVQGSVMVTPLAAGLYTAVMLVRGNAQRAGWLAAGLVAAGMMPLLLPAMGAVVRHAIQAATLHAVPGMPHSYRSLRVVDDGLGQIELERVMSGTLDGPATLALARIRPQHNAFNALPEREYASTIARLPAARELCGATRDRTAVLDYANVSASLFAHAPVASYTNLHWNRNFSAAAHLPPERLFRGADCLLEPKLPQNPLTTSGIRTVYGAWITANFSVSGETPYWRVLIRNE
jgi:hypothetical protein